MSVNRWKFLSAPLLILGLASPALVDCGAKVPGGLPGVPSLPSCPEMDSGDFSQAKFEGGPVVEARIKGFLDSAYTFNKLVVDMETDLITTCGSLGKDIGVDAASLDAKPDGGKGAEKVCGAVAAKITSMLKASGGATLGMNVGTPSCRLDIEAMTKCLGVAVKPGELKADCSGGDISGQCDGACNGTCEADASAGCAGTCKGKCDGTCDATFSGTCGGVCKGKCDGKAMKSGACKGKCDGGCDAKASGTCGGTCSGTCDVACTAKAGAKCSGNCTGGCSVAYKAPKCTGDFKPPSADPKLLLSCGLKALAATKCDVPVQVTVNGQANSDIQKLVTALQAALPKIVAIQKGTATKLTAAGVGVVKGGVDIKDVATSGGLHAGACIANGVGVSTTAAAAINTDVSASASVSVSVGGASASASASGKAGG
jgi:hypothetical protein